MEKNSDDVRTINTIKEVPQSTRDFAWWMIVLFAISLTILWPGALIAFLYGLLGAEGFTALALEWKVAIAIGALALVPAIWLTAYTWIKARDLAREARHLAHQSNRFLVPQATAADEIAHLGDAVRKEVDGLTKGIEAALARVADLEESVKQQSDDLETAALEAENRARELRHRMERERDQLKSLASDLTERTDSYAQKISSQAEWMKNLSDEAYEKFNTASEDLTARSKDFSGVSTDIAAQTREMGASIAEHSRHLKQVSDKAFERSEDIAKRYDQQRQDIEQSTDRLDDQNERLERVLENQRDVLAQIAIVVGDQTEVLQSSVAKCADDLQEALDKAVTRAGEAAKHFQSEVAASTSGSDEAVGALLKAAETAGQAAKQAQTALLEESEAATKAVRTQAALSKDLIGSLFSEFEDGYRDKAKDLLAALGEETGQFKEQIQETNTAAQNALTDQTTRAHELIGQSTAAVEAAAGKLGQILETLQSTSLQATEAFAKSAEKVEGHVEAFPKKTDEAAAYIRQALDEELNAFARLADEASRKISNLSAAVGRHLPAVQSQIGRGEAPQQSPYRAAEFRTDKISPPDGPKSEWAWRELLSKIEAPQEPEQGGAPKKSLSESELNKSAVLVFESLQSMAIDIDKALEDNPPADLLRRYLNGERALFTKRIVEMTSPDTSQRIHDRYLEDGEFRHNVNQYIEQFEGLLGSAVLEDHEDILLDTFLSSHTGKVYLLLGSAVGHFG